MSEKPLYALSNLNFKPHKIQFERFELKLYKRLFIIVDTKYLTPSLYSCNAIKDNSLISLKVDWKRNAVTPRRKIMNGKK